MTRQVVIQAGGIGSRLSELTRDLPKALVPVGGVPMIERLLRQIVFAGFRNVTIISGHLAQAVEEFVNALDLGAGVCKRVIREERPLGNAGALALLREEPGPLLFAFADLVTDLDFAEFARIHERRGADITLTSHYDTHRLAFGELLVENERVVGYRVKASRNFPTPG